MKKKFFWIILLLILQCNISYIYCADINELIKINPEDSPRVEKAKLDLKQSHNNENALFGLAHGYYQMGYYKESVQVYNYMRKIKVTWMHYVESDRAVVLARMGKYKDAEHGFRKAIEYKKDWPHPYAGLATMWVRQHKNYEQVIELVDKAVKYETDNYGGDILKKCYLVQKGAAFIGIKKYDKAVELLEKLKKEIPVNLIPQVYPINDIEAIYELRYYLAIAYFRLNQKNKVIENLQELLDVYETRKKMKPKSRVTSMPSGVWRMIEHPNIFNYLFYQWELP